jgi:hypothetical protein
MVTYVLENKEDDLNTNQQFLEVSSRSDMGGLLVAWYELFTDSLVRYYWLEKWYGDCVGIVEFLAEWVREITTPRDAKIAGILIVITGCVCVAIRTVDFMKQPRQGDSIWKQLTNKEDDE